MADEIATLDLATLNELKAILEEGLVELLEEYLADTPQQLQQLHDCILGGDLDGVASLAHSLKGSSGNLGVSGLYRLCELLEKAARGGHMADAVATINRIDTEFNSARVALKAFMAE